MKKSWSAVALCALVTLSGGVYASPASSSEGTPAAAAFARGKMLVAADGARLAPVYRVAPDGSAQIIIEWKVVTIPASTLSMAGGRLTTTLTKSEVLSLR